MSANVFTPIDFLYSGDTSKFNHLIKKAGKGNKAPSILNHELNLRQYASCTNYKAEEPWIFPMPAKIDPVGADKTVFGHSFQLKARG